MSGIWNGTPNWIRWSLLVSILTSVILLSNAKNAIENLHPFLPVTYGGLEAWAEEFNGDRDGLLASVKSELDASFNGVAWNQLIYRTKDLEFQVELLKSQRSMLSVQIAGNPTETAANEFRQARLEELNEVIARKEAEWRNITCLVENRNQPGAARC